MSKTVLTARLFDAGAVLLIMLAATAWFNYLDYPTNTEVYRDHLVSRHILEYGERPLTGASNQIFPVLRNSPTYVYLTAGLLWLKDDILFLSVVNLILQLFAVGAVYLTARILFSPATGFLAALLYSVTFMAARQAFEPWQPYTMNFFANLSFLLLTLSYSRKSYRWLLTGIVIFVFAGTFHYSLCGLFPLVAAVVILILRSQQANPMKYFVALLTMALAPILFYMPVILYGIQTSIGVASLSLADVLVQSFGEYAAHVGENFRTFIFSFFPDPRGDALVYAVWAVLGLASFFYFWGEGDGRRPRKFYVLLFLLAIIQPLLFSALLDGPRWTYYFTSIFGLFTICLAEIMQGTFSRKWFLVGARIVLALILIKFFSANFYTLTAKGNLAETGAAIREATASISAEIQQLQKRGGYEEPNFFTFLVQKKGGEFFEHHAQFWNLLEESYGRPFTRVIDGGSSYEVLNGDEYIFLVCHSYPDGEAQTPCLDFFAREKPGYSLDRHISSNFPFSVYLMHKK